MTEFTCVARTDFKPLVSFLCAPGGSASDGGCPYDSLHRARAALAILKLPFSQIDRQTAADMTSEWQQRRRNKENVLPPPITATPAAATTIPSASASPSSVCNGFSMRFEDLTPSKLRSCVSMGVARELRGRIHE